MSSEVRQRRSRIAALDVIRGFALCGILLANVQPIAHTDGAPVAVAPESLGYTWLGLFVEQRFYPIFSLLFGVGFSLLLRSAAERTARPRLLLLRRLVALLAMGAAHHLLLWQGDILAVYAVVGLVVLLPSAWLPRRAVAGLAAVLLVAALALVPGPIALVPGLFLLGSALTRYGVIDRLERSTRVPAGLGLLFAVLAVPVAVLQLEQVRFSLTLALAGLLTAGAYICGMLVLLRTPLRRALEVVFAPLGRMALTNYLSATVLVLLVAPLVGGVPHEWPAGTVLIIAGGVLVVQWVWSTLWLGRYLQGPVEWLWRWVTWGRRPAALRTGERAGAGQERRA
ncbi:putative membrane protein YeiB [Nonomuraea thailandensis]|uniref:Membrane protein YeiB n=1 Tax=Nonomuraea thailandensis TaxID=1188745 RepID=A0A9X2K908_9ACTN|nr:DUF418 domain-containing protein [Nonomuraea thailandensis]MCP2364134.1 putative membrane protein YeiB [Nonomuraea thailandensis]